MASLKEAAESYLTLLLNKTLRITTTDTRMFLGEFKCTDSERNIILARTYEYRLPTPPSSSSSTTTNVTNPSQKVVLDMTSRYLGLVVVPGEYISKIEVEEFASQIRAQGSQWAGLAGIDVQTEVKTEVSEGMG